MINGGSEQLQKDNATIICSSKVIDVPEIEPKRTLKDQVEDLEKENANLKEQLTDTQLALCEVYEMIGG